MATLLTKPSTTKVDIVFSYTSFLKKILAWIGGSARRHKVKTVVVVLGLYAAHRTFGLYKSLRESLNPFAELQQLAVDGGDEQENVDNPSLGENDKAVAAGLAKLKEYLRSDAMHLL